MKSEVDKGIDKLLFNKIVPTRIILNKQNYDQLILECEEINKLFPQENKFFTTKDVAKYYYDYKDNPNKSGLTHDPAYDILVYRNIFLVIQDIKSPIIDTIDTLTHVGNTYNLMGYKIEDKDYSRDYLYMNKYDSSII